MKQKLRVDLQNPNLGSVAAIAKTYKSTTTQVRNQVIRYVSDYISEEIPGFGKKISSRDADRLFTTPATAPDGQMSAEDFNKRILGNDPNFKVSQTKLLKDNRDDIAFFETKVKGLGDSGDLSFTAIDISKKTAPESFRFTQDTLDRLNRQNISGVDAYEFVFGSGNQLGGTSRKLLAAIEEKFENLLIVNTLDAQKKRTLQFNFVKSPLSVVNLKDPASFSRYINLRIRPRTRRIGGSDKRQVVSFRIEAKPTAALIKSWEKSTKDITQDVLKAHSGAFSTGLRKYVYQRIERFANTPVGGKLPPKQKVTDLLAFTTALADEFKLGGFTPLQVRTGIGTPSLGNLTGVGKVIQPAISSRSKTQRFISGAQLTQLVQRRLGKTMRRFGDPNPPDLKERTGQFRRSVNIVANYRKNLIMFYYNPVYDALEKYDYEPAEQVERATREVVQSLYSRRFNIVKG